MKQPVFLLAGGRPRGRDTTDQLIRSVLDESGKDSPSIAYTGTASGDDSNFFSRMAGMLKMSGAGTITHAVIAPNNADLNKVRDILQAADIIFVGGGDVDSGMRVLKKKNMLPFLEELYQQGKVFFGTSAGAIMLAKEWVRWTDPDDPDSAEIFPCLNYAPVICDCHDEEGGWQELVAALELKEIDTIGYGLSSGTGIKVYSDGSVEALAEPVHRYVRKPDGIKKIADLPRQ
ncbi:MAG TPA: type 1 glutamine amidotransferase-like domain-containing protein [Dehalococcoidia bacterium]|nr:type 1 glutamine amidotransferase-like domain-containing protein [Dehalococcoidia bacterium]